jgi:hypothetical protein
MELSRAFHHTSIVPPRNSDGLEHQSHRLLIESRLESIVHRISRHTDVADIVENQSALKANSPLEVNANSICSAVSVEPDPVWFKTGDRELLSQRVIGVPVNNSLPLCQVNIWAEI